MERKVKGVYALIIEIPRMLSIKIGAMGNITFDQGYWIYVGSARGTTSTNLEKRLQRHFRKEKKIQWHIDWLLDANVKLIDAYWGETERDRECDLVVSMMKSTKFTSGPKGFGSSDCTRGCLAHLLHYNLEGSPADEIISAMRQAGLHPEPYSELR